MPSIEDTIAALEAKLKQAKARKQLVEARKHAVVQKFERRQDTRRKVLVGAVVLAQVDRGDGVFDAGHGCDYAGVGWRILDLPP